MKKKEFAIIGVILAIALTWLGYHVIEEKNKTYAIVTDTYRNEVVLRFDINKDAYYELDVLHGKFHIEVKDGKYRAIDVDCPNQQCVDMGWMPSFDFYAPIICIPNGIIITIED